MKKCVLTSLLTLLTYSAYGAFDFENYVPTLDMLYGTFYNPNLHSGYNIYFETYQPDILWQKISYYSYTNDDMGYLPYYYKLISNKSDYKSGQTVPNDYAFITGNFININDFAVDNYRNNTTILGDFIGNNGSFFGYGDNPVTVIRNMGTISNLTGDFIKNTALAIWNVKDIDSITGNFIGNLGTGSRSVVSIYNTDNGTIHNINGNFIGNRSESNDSNTYPNKYVGGILNVGTINNITGDFIGNSASCTTNCSGLFVGAILNYRLYYGGIIDNITGSFNGNYGWDVGAINNAGGVIGNLVGDFIGNSGGKVGAINNTGTINSIIGNFIKNTGTVRGAVGAINNTGTIGNISGNFIGNTAINNSTNQIKAPITSNNLHFISNVDSYIISDNYSDIIDKHTRYDYAILITDNLGNLSFENNNSTYYAINDEIDGNNYILNVTGDNTGHTIFNNNINNAEVVNISNGKMVFGRTPNDYTGTSDIGRFSGTNPTVNLNNGTFDIANGYTETITLNNLTSTGDNNVIKIDLNVSDKISDIVISENTIEGQINLAVKALANLDIDDTIIWFAQAENNLYQIASADTFVLTSIENLSYNLNLVFDSINKKWGLRKDPNSTFVPDNPDNPDNPENPDTPDNPDNPDNPENPDTPDNPDNPENPDTPDNPDESEQPIQPVIPVLPVEVVRLADYTAKTVTNTIQKLTNSMQKRVGELQWLLKDTDNQSDLNNAFWTRGIHKNFDTDNTSVGLSGLEFGYDRIISSTNNYKWYVGGLGYISGGDSKFKDTKLDISGYGLGAYLMVLEKSGWFADVVFRQHFINMETSDVKTDYTASSFNLEIGKEFVFGADTDKLKWFMKPSLEGTYISISGTDIGSFKVQDSTSSMASLSVLAGPRWDFASGRKFQAYSKVGYTLDNSDDVDVIVNGVNTKQTVATNTTELGVGFDYSGIDNTTNIYLEASYITGTDYSEISGNIGFRYEF